MASIISLMDKTLIKLMQLNCTDVCRSCLDDSRVLLTQLCPNQKAAIGFYDNCMLRYSNRSISGVMEDSPWYYSWEGNNVTDADQYNQVLYKLLPELQSKAAAGDSRIKFATGNATGPNFQKIYALVQCTPGLNTQIYGDCLSHSFSEIRECCDRKGGIIIGRPSCNVRYISRETGSSGPRSDSTPNLESANEASITELYPR